MVRGHLVLRAGIACCVALIALTGGSPARAAQGYWWEWSDGSTALHRTFSLSQYGLRSNLPRLVVHAEPATPSREVVLSFKSGPRWLTEDSARTDVHGLASIGLDPLCGRNWCDTTFTYRMIIAGQRADLTVTYAAR